MCYSAQISTEFRKFLRLSGARLSLPDFAKLYLQREQSGGHIKIPKVLDALFLDPQNDAEREIKSRIEAFNKAQAARFEEEILKQRERLAHAERSLQTKVTKRASEDMRIATAKIEATHNKLLDLRRVELLDRDGRIFAGSYAPVMAWEDDQESGQGAGETGGRGHRAIRPMRYQCRLAGKPAYYDTKYPGTFNARRDHLEGFWRGLFGVSHGILAVSAFYENVDRDGKNVVLEFRPRPVQVLLAACLWSHWEEPGEPDLLSFAAITDEPPAEVAAAGHGRCIVPIKPEHVDEWLRPDRGNLSRFYAILDDREQPYYEHRLAA
jgi:putative SOS response-associated peptidase YedK